MATSSSPNGNRSFSLLLVGAIVLVLVLLVTWQFVTVAPSQEEREKKLAAANLRALSQPSPPVPETATPEPPPLPTSTLAPFVSKAAYSLGGIKLAEPPLHLMDGYAAKDVEPQGDIAILQDTLQHFLTAVPMVRRPPLGTNQEYTRALSGDNVLRIAFLAPDSPQIVDGQLTDRWGTPIFFHGVSDAIVELRSAGPDHKMWTEDDLFTPPENTAKYRLNSP